MAFHAANADVVRCEVSDRTHRLVPEWIEYEFDPLVNQLEIRDSVGADNGVDWVRGRILENDGRRLSLAWNVGNVPIGPDWPGMRTIVSMRMTRLPDGKILVSGIPTRVPRGDNHTYNGRAVCSG
jgi:hypothetical protein